jgi:hypothetical protein
LTPANELPHAAGVKTQCASAKTFQATKHPVKQGPPVGYAGAPRFRRGGPYQLGRWQSKWIASREMR